MKIIHWMKIEFFNATSSLFCVLIKAQRIKKDRREKNTHKERTHTSSSKSVECACFPMWFLLFASNKFLSTSGVVEFKKGIIHYNIAFVSFHSMIIVTRIQKYEIVTDCESKCKCLPSIAILTSNAVKNPS